MAETDNIYSNPPVDIPIESENFNDNDYSFTQFNFQNDDGNAYGPMIYPNNYFLIEIDHDASFEVMLDVITISETWNDPTTLEPYNIPMYNVFHV